jgi:hypothetical protein
MTPSPLWTSLRIATLAALAPVALAQAPQTFTLKQVVQLAPGGDKERAAFSKLPGLADLVKGKFAIGKADLNGDGLPEMFIVSLVCDATGCPVVVLQSAGADIAPIFVRKIAGRVAITREMVNGYYALAAADQSGAIMKDANGQQLVYPLGGASTSVAPTAAPSAPHPPTQNP